MDGRSLYYEMFWPFYYSFNVGPAYFMVLDNANQENIDPWQMIWLKEELEKSKSFKYRFVFFHVPLFSPTTRKTEHVMSDIQNAKELNKLFDDYNVTMIFSSHIHAYYTGILGKTPFIITGGAGAELIGVDPQHDFYHYIKVNVTPTK